MKTLILPIAVAASALFGCSDGGPSVPTSESPSEEAVETAVAPRYAPSADRIGWPPGEACSFLSPALVTREYKHGFNGEYHCSSPYKEIGDSSSGLPNNLAYYVIGTSDVAGTAKLVLNYNQPARATAATRQLVAAAKNLSLKATGDEIPDKVLSAISSGRSEAEISGEFQHEVKRDDWPTGNGYEVHYIVTRLTGR